MNYTLFGLVWIGILTLVLLLDWIGNPQRGRFRPAREPVPVRGRRRRRRRARAATPPEMTPEDAAAVRRVLDRMPSTGQDRDHGSDDASPAPVARSRRAPRDRDRVS